MKKYKILTMIIFVFILFCSCKNSNNNELDNSQTNIIDKIEPSEPTISDEPSEPTISDAIQIVTGEKFNVNEQIIVTITGYSIQSADDLGQELMGYSDEEYTRIKDENGTSYEGIMDLVHIELPENHIRITVYLEITNMSNTELSMQPFSGEDDNDTPLPKIFFIHPNLHAELPFRTAFWDTKGQFIPAKSSDKLLSGGTATARIELAILETELPKINTYMLRLESDGNIFEWMLDNQLIAPSNTSN